MRLLLLSFLLVLGLFAGAFCVTLDVPAPVNSSLFFPEYDHKIVGGHFAKLGEAPHQVSLRYRAYDFHFCGGSIIGKRWILTAAHCVSNFRPNQLEIVAGNLQLGFGGKRYRVERIVSHKGFKYSTVENDIALMKLTKDIKYSKEVNAIKLNSRFLEGTEPVTLFGWGLTNVSFYHMIFSFIIIHYVPLFQFPGNISQELKKLDLKSVSSVQCIVRYFDLDVPPVKFRKNLCAFAREGEGACKGDSGGGLVDKDTGEIAGVVSWGLPCARGKPDVYTRVFSYRKWIQQNMY